MLHILDDFLFLASSLEKCHTDLANFLSPCDYLRVLITHNNWWWCFQKLHYLSTICYGTCRSICYIDSATAPSFNPLTPVGHWSGPSCCWIVNLLCMLNSWFIMIMLHVSLRNLLVRDAFKVVPLEFAMPSNFWFVFYGWSSLSVSRPVVLRWDPKSNRATKPCYK